jgi:hypothetical protein
VRQAVLGDGRPVDEGAVARAAVTQHEVAVLAGDLGVLPRDVAADETDVALGATADRQRGLVDGMTRRPRPSFTSRRGSDMDAAWIIAWAALARAALPGAAQPPDARWRRARPPSA